MRKIALIGMVLIALTAVGCTKKSEESSESQMAPAPSSQEAAPAASSSQETAPAPATTDQAAPMSGESTSKPEDSQEDKGNDNNTGN